MENTPSQQSVGSISNSEARKALDDLRSGLTEIEGYVSSGDWSSATQTVSRFERSISNVKELFSRGGSYQPTFHR